MRLAQLARRIAVKPSDIVEFLADNNIQIESTSNAKVNDSYVDLVIKHFSPEHLSPEETIADGQTQGEIDTEQEQVAGGIEVTEKKIEVVDPEEDVEAIPEVIRPAKVELPGLKVIGKIDLPEIKLKDENPEPTDSGKDQTLEALASEELPRRKARPENRRKVQTSRENNRIPQKNPIALQREREEREALHRRQKEKEREKKLRTHRYLKKVSAKETAPKPVKQNKYEDEYEVYDEAEVKPKSVIERILNWFVSK